MLTRVKASIAELRGLDFLEPVQAEYLPPSELTGYLEELMDEEEREELYRLDELLTFLGLINADLDLIDLYLDLLAEGVLGAYDTEYGRLVVRLEGSSIGPSEELTLAHELTHALQQHHFDIDSLLEDAGDNFDRGLAISALAEGDATIAELRYLRANSLSLPPTPKLPVYDSAPKIIQDLLLFPYAAGLQMLTQNFGEKEWSRINAAYQDPPTSTEQVLHPEKYIEGETPSEVVLPDVDAALESGWAPIYSSVGGEFLLIQHLGSRLNARTAAEAAAGWGGDAFALYGGPDEGRLLLWAFQWDSVGDADEFFDGYAKFTEGESSWDNRREGAGYRWWGKPSRWVYLQRSADYVSLIIAPSEELAARLSPLLRNP